MKRLISCGVKRVGVFSVLTGIFMFLLVPAQSAYAVAAADAVIINVVTVTYKTVAGGADITANASAKVTINLVEAALTHSMQPDGTNKGDTKAVVATGNTISSGATTSYNVAVTANANGDDEYDLVIGKTESTMIGSTVTWQQLNGLDAVMGSFTTSNSVTLGASVVYNVVSSDTIQFPAGTITGFATNDIVVINGVDYIIAGIGGTDTVPTHANGGGVFYNSVGALTPESRPQIQFAAYTRGSNTTPAFAGAIPDGTQVGEMAVYKVTVTGTVASSGTVSVTFSTDTNPDGTYQSGTNGTTSSDQLLTTFTKAKLEISKVVKNITDATAYASTQTGDQGDVLEYKIIVKNPSAGQAFTVSVADQVPDYTTLQSHTAWANSSGSGAATDIFARVIYNSAVNTTHDITIQNSDIEGTNKASGTASGTAATSNLNLYLGTGVTGSAGGTVDNNATDQYEIYYRVKIDTFTP